MKTRVTHITSTIGIRPKGMLSLSLQLFCGSYNKWAMCLHLDFLEMSLEQKHLFLPRIQYSTHYISCSANVRPESHAQSSWLFSCHSAISLVVEFSVSSSKRTGNNKEQTLQSAEEVYYPSFHLLIGMPLEGQCGLRHWSYDNESVCVSETANSGARGESASVRTYSCWGAEVRTVHHIN